MSVSANRLPLAARAAGLLVSPSALGRWAAVATVAVAYFVTASLALKLAIPPGYASAFWPPAGVALAAWLLLGSRVWPGIWLGATLANYGVLGTPALTAMAIGAGNTAEAGIAALLIGRLVGTPLRFEHPDEPWRFAAGACAACLVAATGGVLTLALSGRVPWVEFGTHWFVWWLGDATGIFVLTPLLLAWAQPSIARPRRTERAVFLAILVLCGALAQLEDRTLRDALHVLAYLMIPLITWAATRLDLRAVTAASFATGVVAVVDLVDGEAALFGPVALAGALLLTQVVISLMALLGLTLSAMAGELARARDALARREAPADADAATLTLLSKREMDVLRLIVEGKTSAEAALILHLSPRSVETYRNRVMHKLGTHNLPALVKYAIRRGITTLE